jgi:hypothetical protein
VVSLILPAQGAGVKSLNELALKTLDRSKKIV